MSTNSINSFETLDYLSRVIEDWSIRLSPRFLTYVPYLDIDIKTKNYTLCTAKTVDELVEVFRLRHQNFLESVENNAGSYDIDDFDHTCDHLIIKSNDDDKIVGTYRILCSKFTDKFYSQGEFDLDDFLKQPGVKLELGRACIDVHHRNGHVIDLLWKGIGAYVMETGADYLFGCSSVKTVKEQTSFDLYNYFRNNDQGVDMFGIGPIGKYAMDFSGCRDSSVMDVKRMVPSLLRSYITAGARVVGRPALDIDFECIDFLTILKIKDIAPSYERRYFKKGE